MIEEFQLLPFTPCRACPGCISGGGVMLGVMVEDHGLDAGPGEVRQGGGGEHRPPQLVQGMGPAGLLALSYGSMADKLPSRVAALASVNSHNKSIQGPSIETRAPSTKETQWIRELQVLWTIAVPC